ncbi:secreted RxLR effector protein 161-like [Teleopsis dalmanni]|uniref:secreted RxLR effector protein 161-like n=1 Tax=Teleopsis dalmanni TaxID=139649 RepID=UPI0018CE03A1|nr:secreted RxLR effector protein 161-like [Teleopsis dalmanni]
MKDCKPVKTPIELNIKLTKPTKIDEGVMKMYPYQSLIGALMYLAVTTRPDIAFAVNFLSQFNSNYNVEHWKAAKRILRYLKGTSNYGLLYEKDNEELYGLVDADWGADLNDRRSYSGYAFIISGAAICWEARKQRTVALSSTESEYMAISEATKEVLYLKAILDDVGITTSGIIHGQSTLIFVITLFAARLTTALLKSNICQQKKCPQTSLPKDSLQKSMLIAYGN